MTTYRVAHTALSRLKTEAQACSDGWTRQARDGQEAASTLRRELASRFCAGWEESMPSLEGDSIWQRDVGTAWTQVVAARDAVARQAADYAPDEDTRLARQALQKKDAAHGEFLRLQENHRGNAVYALWHRDFEKDAGSLPSCAADLPVLSGWRRLLARWQEPKPLRALRAAIQASPLSPFEFFDQVSQGQMAADRLGTLDAEMKEQGRVARTHEARADKGRALLEQVWANSEKPRRQASLAFEILDRCSRPERRAMAQAALGEQSGAWLFQWDQAETQKTLAARAAQYAAAATGIVRQLSGPVDKLAKAARRAGSKSMRSSFKLSAIEGQVRNALARLDEPKAALTSTLARLRDNLASEALLSTGVPLRSPLTSPGWDAADGFMSWFIADQFDAGVGEAVALAFGRPDLASLSAFHMLSSSDATSAPLSGLTDAVSLSSGGLDVPSIAVDMPAVSMPAFDIPTISVPDIAIQVDIPSIQVDVSSISSMDLGLSTSFDTSSF